MSIKVMTWVWDHAEVAAHEITTMLAMADWARDDGTRIYPTIAQLATKTRLSERSVQRIVQGLTARRVIRMTVRGRGRGNVNQYMIPVPWVKGDDVSPLTSDADGGMIKGDISDTEKVTDTPIKGDTPATSNRYQPLLENEEKEINKEKEKQQPLDPSILADWYLDLWAIPGFKKPIAECKAWLDKNDYTEDQATTTASSLKAAWPGNPKRPYTDAWAAFRTWIKRDRDRDRRASTGNRRGATRTENLATSEELEKGWGGNGESSGHPQADS